MRRYEPMTSKILGWFIDNELRWGSDWRGSDELLTLFLGLRAGRRRVVRRLSTGCARAIGIFRGFQRDLAHAGAVLGDSGCIKADRAALYTIFLSINVTQSKSMLPIMPMLRAPNFSPLAMPLPRLVGQRYFETACAAIKAADPNHLILGSRFAYVPPPGVIDAAAAHCDVISINCYDLDPSRHNRCL